jgi:hypothetical protein
LRLQFGGGLLALGGASDGATKIDDGHGLCWCRRCGTSRRGRLSPSRCRADEGCGGQSPESQNHSQIHFISPCFWVIAI